MFLRIAASKEANQAAELAERIHRALDAFEQAKLALQRRGFVVFSHSIHVPGSDLIVVGRQLMTKEQVIAHAERYAAPPSKEK